MGVMCGEASLVLAALVLEASVGFPQWLHARTRHPVVWIGALITALDRRWNDPAFDGVRRRMFGVTAMCLVVGSVVALGVAIEHWASGYIGAAILVLVASTGLAQRSLYVHVRDVSAALSTNDLEAARLLVARIVGRDTDRLTHDQVAAAALESLAESFNDAVIAPAFWLLVGGLPSLFAYKATNTADSMIGHMEERWRMFGWAAARLDDLLNLIPARIAGVLVTIAAGSGFAVMLRDASKHASPNSGWPQAAFAGGLAVRLGGRAYYDGVLYDRPNFGDGVAPTATDLQRGLRLYLRACALLWLVVAAIAVASCLAGGAL